MTDAKKRVVAGGLLLIALGWLSVLWLDWSRLFSFASTGRFEEYMVSRQIKLALSFVVALLVWTTGSARLSPRDQRLMQVVFTVVFLADIIFYLGNYRIGIAVFSVAQIVLIIRNGTGITSLSAESSGRKLRLLLIIAAAILGVNCILLRVLFVLQAAVPLFPLIAGYSLLLCCSLWTGIAAGFIAYFPPVNARCIVIGVSLLFLGDLTVGLNLVLPHDRSYIISTSLTWFFYLPAIVLIALSGYQWKKQLCS